MQNMMMIMMIEMVMKKMMTMMGAQWWIWNSKQWTIAKAFSAFLTHYLNLKSSVSARSAHTQLLLITLIILKWKVDHFWTKDQAKSRDFLLHQQIKNTLLVPAITNLKICAIENMPLDWLGSAIWVLITNQKWLASAR